MNETTDAPNGDQSRRKYVFVGGSPRSGTSLLGRNIARLEDCTGLENTGVFEDEGQFLQDVYAVASEYGGSSRCGFDPRIHRTETSELLTPENIRRLHACWHAYWDNTKTIFVEKTPENFLMARFLQVAFPNSYFVVIKRHPVPVSIAGQKWTVNITSLNRMFQHWLRCYSIFEQDKKYLKNFYELRYEDYVERSIMRKLLHLSAHAFPNRQRKTPFALCCSSGVLWVCAFPSARWRSQAQLTTRSTLTDGHIS